MAEDGKLTANLPVNRRWRISYVLPTVYTALTAAAGCREGAGAAAIAAGE
jgi:hypothetical protein